MNKTDREIWKEKLDNKENAERFNVKNGGDNIKYRQPKKIFKSESDKEIEERLDKLEKKMEDINKILKVISSKLN